jgi:hypothetical protein
VEDNPGIEEEQVAEREGMLQLSVRVPAEIKEAFDADCAARETNKTVLLSTILARRYKIAYKPSERSASRTTPHGGGEGRPR